MEARSADCSGSRSSQTAKALLSALKQVAAICARRAARASACDAVITGTTSSFLFGQASRPDSIGPDVTVCRANSQSGWGTESSLATTQGETYARRSEERRVGKECR